MGKYTVFGSSNFEQRIEEVLELICRRFVQSIDSSMIHALILGGGYGKGEGGVLLQDKTESLYNDLDFFVISKKMSPLKLKRLNHKLKALHHVLTDEFGVDIDFSPVQPITALSKAPCWLVWFELKYGHQVIFGRHDILKYLPKWKSGDLPLMEGLKLMLNRAMGLYFVLEKLQNPIPEDEDFIVRNIHKAYQAMGDAILISEGKYHWSNLVRQERLPSVQLDLYTKDPDFLDNYNKSVDFKLQPVLHHLTQAQTTEILSRLLGTFEEVYYALWARNFGRQSLSYEKYLYCLQHDWEEPADIKETVKNIILNVRSSIHGRLSVDLITKYPRYRLFYALPWLIFNAGNDHRDICRVLSMPESASAEELKQRFVNMWLRFN